MVTIWLLSKYSVILTVALSLLSVQYEGSFLATKLCSQTTPVKNNPPEEEEAASRARLLHVPWPRCVRERDGERLTGQTDGAYPRSWGRASAALVPPGVGHLGGDHCPFCRWVNRGRLGQGRVPWGGL